jgi:putative nucleotidyltransferase with HDIG domain
MVAVCASMSVISTFDSWETQQLNRQGIWKHSLSTGFLAKSLEMRKDMHRNDSPDLFLAGLVHHIGWIVMDQYFSEELEKILDLVMDTPVWDTKYEEEIIGINHAELGALFLEKWGMPESIVSTVRYHHDFDLYEKYPGHAALINLAAYLAPYKFKLEPRLETLSDHIPNRLQSLKGPKLISEMEMRYNTSIKQASMMTDRMMSWM